MRTIRWTAVLAILALLGFTSAALAKPPPGKPASRCGDGVVDSNEQCDQGSLGGATCQSLGYDLGTLTCGANCQFETSQCRDAVCGDGVVEVGEQCDSGNLGGETCLSLGYQTGDLSCSASCEFDPASCGCRAGSLPVSGQNGNVYAGEDGNPAFGAPFAFQDNNDGTITDLATGLMWEKKDAGDFQKDGANLHDADNCHPWIGICSNNSGLCASDADCADSANCNATDCQSSDPSTGKTAFEWVAALNANGFAGYSDWRIPNVRELASIVNYGNSAGRDPQFFPDNGETFYWTSTRSELNQFAAWYVWDGFVGTQDLGVRGAVRAVRGGTQP